MRCSDSLQGVFSPPIESDWKESSLLKEQQIVVPVLLSALQLLFVSSWEQFDLKSQTKQVV